MTRSFIVPGVVPVPSLVKVSRSPTYNSVPEAGPFALYAVTAACTAAAKFAWSVGGAVGESQMDRRRLARLQRAGQVHRVARIASFGDARVRVSDQVAVLASVVMASLGDVEALVVSGLLSTTL